MIKCWEMAPAQRASFKEIHSNISKYIGQIGGYLDLGAELFTTSSGLKEEESENESSDPETTSSSAHEGRELSDATV